MKDSSQLECRRLTLAIGVLWTFALASSHFQGRSFIVAFPSKTALDQSYQQYISLASAAANVSASVSVTVTKNATVVYRAQVRLQPSQGCLADCFNASVTANLSRIQSPVVSVTSTGDVVVLAYSTSGASYADYFLVMPVPELSTGYLVVAECPTSVTCVVVVATGTDSAVVEVTFALDAKTTPVVNYNNTLYYNGDVLRRTLGPWATMEIQALEVNLSGSIVVSSSPVAVFSGTETISGNVVKQYNVEELVPVGLFDSEYVVIDCPVAGATTYVRVIYAESNTTVAIDPSVLTLKTSRSRIQIYTLKQHGSSIVRSDMPVMVQLIYGDGDNLILQPVSKWARSYVTVLYNPCNVLLITRSSCTGDFLFNGNVASGFSWNAVGDGTYRFSDTPIKDYGSWLNITLVNCTFAGIVYSTSAKSYAMWSLGWGPEHPLTAGQNVSDVNLTSLTTGTSWNITTARAEMLDTTETPTTSGELNNTDTVTRTGEPKTSETLTAAGEPNQSSYLSVFKRNSILPSQTTSVSSISKSQTTTLPSQTTSVSIDSKSPTTTAPSKNFPSFGYLQIQGATASSKTTSSTKTAQSSSPNRTRISSNLTTQSPTTTKTSVNPVPGQPIQPNNFQNTTTPTTISETVSPTTHTMAAVSPTNALCSCTCRFAQKMTSFPGSLARQGELTDGINGDLLLEKEELSAQKKLKITAENGLISEQAAGWTIFLAVMMVAVGCLTCSDVIRLVRYLKKSANSRRG